MLAAAVVFVFVGMSMNAADTIDDVQMVKVANLGECHRLVHEYDKAHLEENAENPPAFRLRWSTDCKTMILAENSPGV